MSRRRFRGSHRLLVYPCHVVLHANLVDTCSTAGGAVEHVVVGPPRHTHAWRGVLPAPRLASPTHGRAHKSAAPSADVCRQGAQRTRPPRPVDSRPHTGGAGWAALSYADVYTPGRSARRGASRPRASRGRCAQRPAALGGPRPGSRRVSRAPVSGRRASAASPAHSPGGGCRVGSLRPSSL